MSHIDEMLEINIKQKDYYEEKKSSKLESKGNLITKLWRNLRRSQQQFREDLGIQSKTNALHKEWLADLSEKSVLDLGCFSGNDLSCYIAENAKSYMGLDLSSSAIAQLNEKIKYFENATAISADFLSEEFQQKYKNSFDIIYAKSVAHHFQYFEDFIKYCINVLKPNGLMITFDPIQTYKPLKLLRNLYRPFQSDRFWEFPFDKSNFLILSEYFDIEDVQGVMGKAKNALPYYWINQELGKKKAEKYQLFDEKYAVEINKYLYNCMQVSLKMRLK